MPIRHRAAALAAAFIAALTVFAAPAPAAPRPEEHCVLHVVGQADNGELLTEAPVCFASAAAAAASPLGATSTIAVHYDGANFTGSSITISGSTCSGGWLNLSFAWRNRISSTQNFCPQIRHFDGLNLTGAWQATFGTGGNLSTLNNKTESVQYTS